MYHRTTYVFDFDKTIVSAETLDLIGEIALAKVPNKAKILRQVKNITEKGMNGTLSFTESLNKRIQLLPITKVDIHKTIRILKKSITPSIKKNKDFFCNNKDTIYIVSGGFKECIVPVVSLLGIDESHVFGNTFKYGNNGNVIGFDTSNPLSKDGGKIDVVRALNKKNVVVIGDGFTDLQIKKMGAASHFVAFTENCKRDNITNSADEVVNSFDEFLFNNNLPTTLSYPKSKIKVVLFESIHNEAVTRFEKEGYRVEWYEKSYSQDELSAKVKGAMIVGIRSRTQLNAQVLSEHPTLRAIGVYCIGTNQIDISTAAKHGIAVFNAPYGNTRSVVELAVGEMIMLSRFTFERSKEMHSGVWNKTAKNAHELRGKVLGIVGYGNIGSQLSVVAEALGMRVLYFDIRDVLPIGNASPTSLNNLLENADIVTVHVDGRRENTKLIGRDQFKRMKRGVIFLNLSRGSVVDIEELARFLSSGHIVGAAIDVFPQEPKSKEEAFSSRLRHIPNVILTPHIAGSTEESQRAIGIYTTNKIIQFVNTGNTDMCISLPSITVNTQEGAHRLLHIHANMPGMLAQINGVLAKHELNITQQSLKTNEHVGYVVTDVERSYSKEVINDLKAIPHTLRFRVLYT